MAGEVRKECSNCGVHTFRSQCGNCGSADLRAVPAPDPDRPGVRRFARQQPRRLAGVGVDRGLRSDGVF